MGILHKLYHNDDLAKATYFSVGSMLAYLKPVIYDQFHLFPRLFNPRDFQCRPDSIGSDQERLRDPRRPRSVVPVQSHWVIL